MNHSQRCGLSLSPKPWSQPTRIPSPLPLSPFSFSPRHQHPHPHTQTYKPTHLQTHPNTCLPSRGNPHSLTLTLTLTRQSGTPNPNLPAEVIRESPGRYGVGGRRRPSPGPLFRYSLVWVLDLDLGLVSFRMRTRPARSLRAPAPATAARRAGTSMPPASRGGHLRAEGNANWSPSGLPFVSSREGGGSRRERNGTRSVTVRRWVWGIDRGGSFLNEASWCTMGGSGGTSGVNEVYIMCRGGIYERCGDVGIRIGYVGTRRRGEKVLSPSVGRGVYPIPFRRGEGTFPGLVGAYEMHRDKRCWSPRRNSRNVCERCRLVIKRCSPFRRGFRPS